jgi:hypothetical protein
MTTITLTYLCGCRKEVEGDKSATLNGYYQRNAARVPCFPFCPNLKKRREN